VFFRVFKLCKCNVKFNELDLRIYSNISKTSIFLQVLPNPMYMFKFCCSVAGFLKVFSKWIFLLKHFKDNFRKPFFLFIHELLAHRSYRNRQKRKE